MQRENRGKYKCTTGEKGGRVRHSRKRTLIESTTTLTTGKDTDHQEGMVTVSFDSNGWMDMEGT